VRGVRCGQHPFLALLSGPSPSLSLDTSSSMALIIASRSTAAAACSAPLRTPAAWTAGRSLGSTCRPSLLRSASTAAGRHRQEAKGEIWMEGWRGGRSGANFTGAHRSTGGPSPPAHPPNSPANHRLQPTSLSPPPSPPPLLLSLSTCLRPSPPCCPQLRATRTWSPPEQQRP
jgi:hypothetical protein